MIKFLVNQSSLLFVTQVVADATHQYQDNICNGLQESSCPPATRPPTAPSQSHEISDTEFNTWFGFEWRENQL